MKKNVMLFLFTLVIAISLSGVVSAAKISDHGSPYKFSATGYQDTASTAFYTQKSAAGSQTIQKPQNSQNSPDPLNTRTHKSYTTIQSAIDDPATKNGDTIQVEPGIYTENVVVNKALKIISTGTATVQAADPNLPVFTITSSGGGSTIKNFTITGSSNSYGIFILSSFNRIENNLITNNKDGIGIIGIDKPYPAGAYGNTIYNNKINGNAGDGIYLQSSQINIIMYNEVRQNLDYGIHLLSSNSNTFVHNDMTLNGLGDRFLTGGSSGNVFSGNTPAP